MRLIFPFKNIVFHRFLQFVDDRKHIYDFILTQKGEYPYSDNYFLKWIEYFKNTFPDFENEILQIINTTNQETIDFFFSELDGDLKFVLQKLELEDIQKSVEKWNSEIMKSFEEDLKKVSDEYFASEKRKLSHLEEYETLDYGNGLFFGRVPPKKVKKINYNFYCIEKQPKLIDESYCKHYQNFLQLNTQDYFEISYKYLLQWSDGKILSKVEQVVFNKPVVFVEGEHDITFIKRAAELLDKRELLNKIELRQRGGYRNLDKMWEILKENNWETIPQKKLLLYDCDTKKTNQDSGTIFKRIITTIPGNKINKGIENLFPNSIIEKAVMYKPAFVDITTVERFVRGEQLSREQTCVVNENEKKHFCNWICENGNASDFSHFENVFDLITIVL